MIRKFVCLGALGLLAACGQHREPRANCFSFLASTASVAPDCNFTPLAAPEGDLDV